MPRKAHAAVVNHLIQYVYNTRKLGIRYQRDCAQEKDAPKNYGQGRHPLDTGKNHLAAFVDSDYAADSSRRSRQGSITMMNGGPIAWAFLSSGLGGQPPERRPAHLGFCQVMLFQKTKFPGRPIRTPRLLSGHGFPRQQKPLVGTLARNGLTFFGNILIPINKSPC